MFKYYGAKRSLAHRYPAPEFDVLVEPFAGAAGYAVHHRRHFRRVILIDKDQRVTDLWHRLLSMSRAQILALPTPIVGRHSNDLLVAFAAGRSTGDTSDRFVVTSRMAERFHGMVRHIASVVDECRHFEVHCADWQDAPDLEATWFIDPPYQPRPCDDPSRCGGGRYRYGNRDIDYQALASWCQHRSGQVIVCEQSGADWLSWNGALDAHDSTHRQYREVLWHRSAPSANVIPFPTVPMTAELPRPA